MYVINVPKYENDLCMCMISDIFTGNPTNIRENNREGEKVGKVAHSQNKRKSAKAKAHDWLKLHEVTLCLPDGRHMIKGSLAFE